MRCYSCGADASVLKVEPKDLNRVRGFELHTLKCKQCGLLEKRLTFDSQRSIPGQALAAHLGGTSGSIEDVLGKIDHPQQDRSATTILGCRSVQDSKTRTVQVRDQREPDLGTYGAASDAQHSEDAPLSSAPTLKQQAVRIGTSVYAHAERAAVGWMQVMESLASDAAKSSTITADHVASSFPADVSATADSNNEHVKLSIGCKEKDDAHLHEPALSIADEERGARLQHLFGKVRAKIRRNANSPGPG